MLISVIDNYYQLHEAKLRDFDALE